ncbi:hypothetical protein EAF04_006582 [Stromatinia cepivora]|nr:hypothetical protein EAF04_006582 [Stromatinia cepivora]
MAQTRYPARRIFYVAPQSLIDETPAFSSSNPISSVIQSSLSSIQFITPEPAKAPGGNREFTYFSRLPSELQIYIWELACELEGQRVVVVYSQRVICSPQPAPRRRGHRRHWTGFTSPTPIPIALHVCSLSRNLALKRYELCFGLTCWSSADISAPPMIYFNLDKDILCFREDRSTHDCAPRSRAPRSCYEPFYSLVNQSDLDKVQYLGFKSHIPGQMFMDLDLFHRDLGRWKSLKQVFWGYEVPGMKACKRINFEELDGDELHFANSCKRNIGDFGGSIFRGPFEEVNEPTRVSVEELLDLVKSHVENGSVPGEKQEESGRAEPRWKVTLGSFQNI